MIRELLKKLSALEPRTCRYYPVPTGTDFMLPIEIEARSEDCLCIATVNPPDPLEAYALAILQFALQEKIAEKGWGCRIEKTGNTWIATVHSASGIDSGEKGVDEKPAIALLSAYVTWASRQP